MLLRLHSAYSHYQKPDTGNPAAKRQFNVSLSQSLCRRRRRRGGEEEGNWDHIVCASFELGARSDPFPDIPGLRSCAPQAPSLCSGELRSVPECRSAALAAAHVERKESMTCRTQPQDRKAFAFSSSFLSPSSSPTQIRLAHVLKTGNRGR